MPKPSKDDGQRYQLGTLVVVVVAGLLLVGSGRATLPEVAGPYTVLLLQAMQGRPPRIPRQ